MKKEAKNAHKTSFDNQYNCCSTVSWTILIVYYSHAIAKLSAVITSNINKKTRHQCYNGFFKNITEIIFHSICFSLYLAYAWSLA